MELFLDTGIWLLASFAAFIFIMWKFAFSKIIAMLDKRIEDIKKEMEMAENLRIEAQELLAQYQRKHRDAMKDAENIIANAAAQAKHIQKQAESDLRDTMKRREDQLAQRLTRMEESAITDIRNYAADLAMNAAAHIISDKLDKKTADDLVKKSIGAVSGKLH